MRVFLPASVSHSSSAARCFSSGNRSGAMQQEMRVCTTMYSSRLAVSFSDLLIAAHSASTERRMYVDYFNFSRSRR